MSPVAARVTQDLIRLKELSKITNNKVKILRWSGSPVNHIEIELFYPTVPSDNYPIAKQESSIVHIDLLGNYPIKEYPPKITVKTPIFHPNIYVNGIFCPGSWNPTEFLDFFVKRFIYTICFYPQYTNPFSPANRTASDWYKKKLITNPVLFPTVDLSTLFTDAPPRPKSIFGNS